MSIKITVSETVRVKVQGTISDGEGPKPFDFSLIARRLDADQLKTRLDEQSDALIVDFLADITTGWAGVKGDTGEEPYSEAGLRQLMKIPGLALLTFRAYLADCGAKAKN